MAEVGFRIDAIEPASPDQTIQQGSSLTAVVAAEEDKILFPKADSTKGSFGSVVIRLWTAGKMSCSSVPAVWARATLPQRSRMA